MNVLPLRSVFYIVLAMAVMVGVVAVAACGGSDDDGDTPASAATALSGTIAIAGSSTVFPISEAVAEEFSKANPGLRVNVASTGTGSGGRAMCQEGTIEVWDASRPAKQEKEVDVCAENGIELIELPVAFDALSGGGESGQRLDAVSDGRAVEDHLRT